MGTCCRADLAAKVRDYAPNAENGSVTVTPLEDPEMLISGEVLSAEKLNKLIERIAKRCDICGGLGEFVVSFFPKKTAVYE